MSDQRLVEYFVVVGAREADISPNGDAEPKVLSRLPSEDHGSTEFPESLPLFTFPYGYRVVGRPSPLKEWVSHCDAIRSYYQEQSQEAFDTVNETFEGASCDNVSRSRKQLHPNAELHSCVRRKRSHLFVLTQGDGSRLYGTSIVTWQPLVRRMAQQSAGEDGKPSLTYSEDRRIPDYHCYVPVCMIILSKFPYYSQFLRFLAYVSDSIKHSYKFPLAVPVERILANLMLESPVPPCGHFKVVYTGFPYFHSPKLSPLEENFWKNVKRLHGTNVENTNVVSNKLTGSPERAGTVDLCTSKEGSASFRSMRNSSHRARTAHYVYETWRRRMLRKLTSAARKSRLMDCRSASHSALFTLSERSDDDSEGKYVHGDWMWDPALGTAHVNQNGDGCEKGDCVCSSVGTAVSQELKSIDGDKPDSSPSQSRNSPLSTMAANLARKSCHDVVYPPFVHLLSRSESPPSPPPPMIFHRPPSNALPLRDFSLKLLFSRFSPENIVLIYGLLLTEQKILFLGEDSSSLVYIMESFVSLLFPFTWSHIYIPVLPAKLIDYVCAPMPFIIGVLRSCKPSRQMLEGVVCVDIERNAVYPGHRSIPNGLRDTVGSEVLPREYSYYVLPAQRHQFLVSNLERLLTEVNDAYNPEATHTERTATQESAVSHESGEFSTRADQSPSGSRKSEIMNAQRHSHGGGSGLQVTVEPAELEAKREPTPEAESPEPETLEMRNSKKQEFAHGLGSVTPPAHWPASLEVRLAECFLAFNALVVRHYSSCIQPPSVSFSLAASDGDSRSSHSSNSQVYCIDAFNREKFLELSTQLKEADQTAQDQKILDSSTDAYEYFWLDACIGTQMFQYFIQTRCAFMGFLGSTARQKRMSTTSDNMNKFYSSMELDVLFFDEFVDKVCHNGQYTTSHVLTTSMSSANANNWIPSGERSVYRHYGRGYDPIIETRRRSGVSTETGWSGLSPFGSRVPVIPRVVHAISRLASSHRPTMVKMSSVMTFQSAHAPTPPAESQAPGRLRRFFNLGRKKKNLGRHVGEDTVKPTPFVDDKSLGHATSLRKNFFTIPPHLCRPSTSEDACLDVPFCSSKTGTNRDLSVSTGNVIHSLCAPEQNSSNELAMLRSPTPSNDPEQKAESLTGRPCFRYAYGCIPSHLEESWFLRDVWAPPLLSSSTRCKYGLQSLAEEVGGENKEDNGERLHELYVHSKGYKLVHEVKSLEQLAGLSQRDISGPNTFDENVQDTQGGVDSVKMLYMDFYKEKRLYSQHFHNLRVHSGKHDKMFEDVCKLIRRLQLHDEACMTSWQQQMDPFLKASQFYDSISADGQGVAPQVPSSVQAGTSVDIVWFYLQHQMNAWSSRNKAIYDTVRRDLCIPLYEVGKEVQMQLKILFEEADLLESRAGHAKVGLDTVRRRAELSKRHFFRMFMRMFADPECLQTPEARSRVRRGSFAVTSRDIGLTLDNLSEGKEKRQSEDNSDERKTLTRALFNTLTASKVISSTSSGAASDGQEAISDGNAVQRYRFTFLDQCLQGLAGSGDGLVSSNSASVKNLREMLKELTAGSSMVSGGVASTVYCNILNRCVDIEGFSLYRVPNKHYEQLVTAYTDVLRNNLQLNESICELRVVMDKYRMRMPLIVKKLRELNRKRMEVFRDGMKSYVHTRKLMIKSLQEEVDALETVVRNVDIDKDMGVLRQGTIDFWNFSSWSNDKKKTVSSNYSANSIDQLDVFANILPQGDPLLAKNPSESEGKSTFSSSTDWKPKHLCFALNMWGEEGFKQTHEVMMGIRLGFKHVQMFFGFIREMLESMFRKSMVAYSVAQSRRAQRLENGKVLDAIRYKPSCSADTLERMRSASLDNPRTAHPYIYTYNASPETMLFQGLHGPIVGESWDNDIAYVRVRYHPLEQFFVGKDFYNKKTWQVDDKLGDDCEWSEGKRCGSMLAVHKLQVSVDPSLKNLWSVLDNFTAVLPRNLQSLYLCVDRLNAEVRLFKGMMKVSLKVSGETKSELKKQLVMAKEHFQRASQARQRAGKALEKVRKVEAASKASTGPVKRGNARTNGSMLAHMTHSELEKFSERKAASVQVYEQAVADHEHAEGMRQLYQRKFDVCVGRLMEQMESKFVNTGAHLIRVAQHISAVLHRDAFTPLRKFGEDLAHAAKRISWENDVRHFYINEARSYFLERDIHHVYLRCRVCMEKFGTSEKKMSSRDTLSRVNSNLTQKRVFGDSSALMEHSVNILSRLLSAEDVQHCGCCGKESVSDAEMCGSPPGDSQTEAKLHLNPSQSLLSIDSFLRRTSLGADGLDECAAQIEAWGACFLLFRKGYKKHQKHLSWENGKHPSVFPSMSKLIRTLFGVFDTLRLIYDELSTECTSVASQLHALSANIHKKVRLITKEVSKLNKDFQKRQSQCIKHLTEFRKQVSAFEAAQNRLKSVYPEHSELKHVVLYLRMQKLGCDMSQYDELLKHFLGPSTSVEEKSKPLQQSGDVSMDDLSHAKNVYSESLSNLIAIFDSLSESVEEYVSSGKRRESEILDCLMELDVMETQRYAVTKTLSAQLASKCLSMSRILGVRMRSVFETSYSMDIFYDMQIYLHAHKSNELAPYSVRSDYARDKRYQTEYIRKAARARREVEKEQTSYRRRKWEQLQVTLADSGTPGRKISSIGAFTPQGKPKKIVPQLAPLEESDGDQKVPVDSGDENSDSDSDLGDIKPATPAVDSEEEEASDSEHLESPEQVENAPADQAKVDEGVIDWDAEIDSYNRASNR